MFQDVLITMAILTPQIFLRPTHKSGLMDFNAIFDLLSISFPIWKGIIPKKGIYSTKSDIHIV